MIDEQRSQIIRMAWEDRTTFDEIKRKTGFTEGWCDSADAAKFEGF